MRRFGVADALLHALNLVFDVTVSYENVLPAIIIVVEEKAAEAKRHQRRAAHFRTRSFVYEQAVAFVVIERKHLIGKVRDDQTGAAGAVVIRGIHAHARARHSIFTERNPGGNSAL